MNTTESLIFFFAMGVAIFVILYLAAREKRKKKVKGVTSEF